MSDPRTAGAAPDGAAPDSAAPDSAAPDSPAPDSAPSGRGLNALTGADFSVAEATGGVRGIVESIAPGLVFVIVYLVAGELTPALVGSCAVTLVAVVARLVQRTPLTQALAGAVGVAVGVFWAARSGQAEDYFVVGLWTNGAYLAACVLSIVVGWPLVGLVVGLLRGEGTTWRADPRARRVYLLATTLWAAMYGLRLAVQLPLYLGAEVGWLGTMRLVMGVPLWALMLWITWLLVRIPAAARDPARSPLDP
ncbi:DUF3159 domain-containing protein [Pengzhenrongella sicca]|uniref:DUF3159 domain-containing protein n=1 Tax=Pengzhenrongella sicca TaxID=2819238 RepID=A0A8A4ZA53_9MICO|nr:DUF3159 domain-containing protein [Pengzhenrongella sicca]QTE28335.1 DUF3159 domain-containing protein [Pengzhenrongella sicca]